jgi:hypothetical protein
MCSQKELPCTLAGTTNFSSGYITHPTEPNTTPYEQQIPVLNHPKPFQQLTKQFNKKISRRKAQRRQKGILVRN